MTGKVSTSVYIILMGVVTPFTPTFADQRDLYSVHTASFVYHAYAPTKDYTQYFKNELIAVEKRLSAESEYSLYAGTMINSEDNRCVLLGMGKQWGEYKKLVIEGLYVYAGEFFFEPFSHCGDRGIYHEFKRITGVGFAPYIYHVSIMVSGMM